MWEQRFLGLFVDPSDYRGYTPTAGADAAGTGAPLVEGDGRAATEERAQSLTACHVAVLLPLALVVAACNLLGAALWVCSVATLAQDRERPCDQPLKGWLAVTVAWVAFDKLYCSYRYNTSFGVGHNIDQNILPALCSVFLRSLFLGSGLWWYSRSEGCARLSPSIHACVRCYLVFHALVVVNKAIVSCALVHLVLRFARSGHFPSAGPRAGRAARAGLVDELATVECAGGLVVEGGSAGAGACGPAPECSVCLVGLDRGGDVKRTPCSPVPHHFHRECLKTWLERYGKTCPVCRADLERAADGSPFGGDLEKAAESTPLNGGRE